MKVLLAVILGEFRRHTIIAGKMPRSREDGWCIVAARTRLQRFDGSREHLGNRRLETRTASAQNESEGLGTKHGEVRWPVESASVVEAVSPW